MRYLFNMAGAVYDPDTVGHDLMSLPEARVQAVKFAAEMLRNRPELAWLGEEFRVEVTNDDQLVLFTIIVLGIDAPVLAHRQ